MVLAGALLLAPLGLRVVGTWLVVDEPLQRSRAIVVFGGALPFRAMEAAALYQQGWASEVWITTVRERSDDAALARLGIHRLPEQDYNVRVLQRLGVPIAAIRVLPEPITNTAEEVRGIARRLQAAGGGAVILVTSRFHTRRVRFLWRRAAAPGSEARVRYSRHEPVDPERWWSNSTDLIAVAREWVGLANALAGFPIRSVPN